MLLKSSIRRWLRCFILTRTILLELMVLSNLYLKRGPCYQIVSRGVHMIGTSNMLLLVLPRQIRRQCMLLVLLVTPIAPVRQLPMGLILSGLSAPRVKFSMSI
ncbi:hypothetical protein LINPERHAP1_LOCUS42751 [Linum perenne]